MADLTGAIFRFSNLSDSMLFRTSLSQSNLRESDLRESNLKEANLSESVLSEVNLSDAEATQADFSNSLLAGLIAKNSDLRGCNLRNSELRGSELTRSNLREADAEEANFLDANLTDVSARDAVLNSCSLENALLTRTDLRGANLIDADLFQVQLSNIRLNGATNFGRECSYEAENRSPRVAVGTRPLEAAAWVYRRLETLYEDNALAEKSRQYHLRKQEVQRCQYRNDGNYDRYAVATLNKHLTNYGESLRRLVIGWVVTILGFALLYPVVGGISDDGMVYKIDLLFSWPTLPNLITGSEVYLRSIYFSTITFTTIGYANVAPHGYGSRILVGLESLFGAILIALFVYVLGRRTSR